MALWISFAFMTAVAALAILRPFWRAQRTASETPRDIEVYRQQLQEIEDEAARGMLGKAEADIARIEISRRILAAAGEKPAPQSEGRATFAPYVLASLLPMVTLALYLAHGSPGYPGQPIAARARVMEGQSVDLLVTRVEERLQRNPDDGMGWSVIAPVYMRMARYDDAAQAFRNATRLLGETADRAANLGEALTLANDGGIDDEARAAFDKAVALDPEHAKARFWLAVAQEQAGRKAEAIAAFRALLGRDLPDAVKDVINQRIALLEGRPIPEAPAAPQAGSDIDPAQINAMVSGLAERLKQDGSDLKGWLMLVRAYTVLGRKDEALTALKEARGQFVGNSDALGQIEALARSLGLPS